MRATLKKLDPILIQAVIAAALSFAHIHDIAEAAGQDGWKAWAYPVSVDLLLVAAWRRMRKNRRDGNAWLWFLIAMAASLSANVLTSGVMNLTDPPNALRVIVAGWPAVAFLGGTLLVHSRSTADEPREAPARGPQATVSEPPAPPAGEETEEPKNEAQGPVLVSYAEAAAAVDVAPETVRGWANNGTVKKYPGPTAHTRCVDLVECKAIVSRRLVGA